MTLYFNNKGISDDWERIEFALGKVKGGKNN